MVPKPTISLHGSGESIVLSNWGGGRFILMQGASGLGMASQELSTAALPQGGATVLHRRKTVREPMIPMLLGGTYEERFEDRRRLERMCAGEVEVRVTQPDGEFRTCTGFYVDGLEGSYEAGEDSPDGQKLVLTFTAPDPSWYGSQQSEVWALSPERMQILSELRGEPSTPQLVRTNYVLNPSIVGTFGRALFVGGDYQSADSRASSENSWRGGTSWRIEPTDTDGDRVGGRVDTGASGAMRYAAGVWVNPGEGVEMVTVQIQSDQSGSWVTTRSVAHSANTAGWLQYTAEEQEVHSGNRRIVFQLSGTEFVQAPAPVPVGSVSFIDCFTLVEADKSVGFFDGDTDFPDHTANWTGTPNESMSEVWTMATGADDMMASPFGYFRLSESTVQGATEVEIAGDADAEAVLVVTGPGEDLEVVNETTGQRIFIASEIDEPITIDARALVQDIYSESRQNGEWWKFVNDDAPLELITLRPGVNRVRVTMVNAHPDSKVELLYRETYHAGH